MLLSFWLVLNDTSITSCGLCRRLVINREIIPWHPAGRNEGSSTTETFSWNFRKISGFSMKKICRAQSNPWKNLKKTSLNLTAEIVHTNLNGSYKISISNFFLVVIWLSYVRYCKNRFARCSLSKTAHRAHLRILWQVPQNGLSNSLISKIYAVYYPPVETRETQSDSTIVVRHNKNWITEY